MEKVEKGHHHVGGFLLFWRGRVGGGGVAMLNLLFPFVTILYPGGGCVGGVWGVCQESGKQFCLTITVSPCLSFFMSSSLSSSLSSLTLSIRPSMSPIPATHTARLKCPSFGERLKEAVP